MTKRSTPINWSYPEPRNALEKFIGPGATSAEIALQFIPTLIAAVGLPLFAIHQGWGWSVIQLIIVGVLVLDMVGGVITNATSTAKRWYHREGQGFNAHMMFIYLHILQPTLVMVFFDRWNWQFVAGTFGYVVIAALLILAPPLYLQRPLALMLTVGGILLGLYVLPVPLYFEWFVPLYFIKLLVSHLLREEPYRPRGLQPSPSVQTVQS